VRGHASFDQAPGGTHLRAHLFRGPGSWRRSGASPRGAARGRVRSGDPHTSAQARGGVRCGRRASFPARARVPGKTTPADAAAASATAANSESRRLLLPRRPACPRPPPAVPRRTVPGAAAELRCRPCRTTSAGTRSTRKPSGEAAAPATSCRTSGGANRLRRHVTRAMSRRAVCCPSRASHPDRPVRAQHGRARNLPPDGGVEVFDDHCTVARW